MSNTWNLESVPSQEGKLAIVTGANVGLGYETVQALTGKGMEVVLAARNAHKAENAIHNIRKKFPGAKLHFMHLDLSRLSSVRAFATAFMSQFGRLDLLINNAGIMMPPYSLTEDGFESQFGTNYLGHFLLTGLLMPALKKSEGSRVVTLSSIAHKYGSIQFADLQFIRSYNKIKAYSQSKLACLMFAYELDRRLRKTGSQVLSVGAHPGVSATHLGRNMSPVMRYFFPRIGQPASAGAHPILMAALGNSVKGGEYYGPDGWLEMRGKPTRIDSTKASKNEESARQLWQISEELTQFRFDI
jgi:NAD(P)-dependent dehydrogenase (short-subunit alcohol dehydrogenase family)